MKTPIEQFQVDASRWRCCEKMRKTEYCPECGKKRPELKWSSRIQDILDGWENDRIISEKAAATLRDRMTKQEIALEKISTVRTWKGLESFRQQLGSFISLHESENLEEAKNQTVEQVKANCERHSATRDNYLQKAALRAYWIRTVTELLELIPAEKRQ